MAVLALAVTSEAAQTARASSTPPLRAFSVLTIIQRGVPTLALVKKQTHHLPILLPGTIRAHARHLYAEGEWNPYGNPFFAGWDLQTRPNCLGTHCGVVASFFVTQSTTCNLVVPDPYDVPLAKGQVGGFGVDDRTGRFIPTLAWCSPPRPGSRAYYFYEFSIRSTSHVAADKSELISLANSAIKAGPR